MKTINTRSCWYRKKAIEMSERPLPRFIKTPAAVAVMGSSEPRQQSAAGKAAAAADRTSELAVARRRKRESEIARGPTTAAFVGKYD